MLIWEKTKQPVNIEAVKNRQGEIPAIILKKCREVFPPLPYSKAFPFQFSLGARAKM